MEDALLADPEAGDRIEGTGGFRKLRVPLEGRGKRAGGRVIYFHVARLDRVYLVAFYAKNVRDNLTQAERNELRRLAKVLESTP